MPQLDKLTFGTQIFWLLLVLVLFYFSLQLWVLPKIEEAVKEREKRNLQLVTIEPNKNYLNCAQFISQFSLYVYDLTVFYAFINKFLETINSASEKLLPLIKTINEELINVDFLTSNNSDLYSEVHNFVIVDLIEEKIV